MENVTTSDTESGAPISVSQAKDQMLNLLNQEQSQDDAQEQQAAHEVEVETTAEEPVIDEQEPETFSLKASGEDVEVTLDELKHGYQRQADYIKKTQAIAEQKKSLEAEMAKASDATQLRDQYAQRLAAVDQLLTQAEPSEEALEKLKESDPAEWQEKVLENLQRKEKLDKLRAERKRLSDQQQAEYQQNLAKHVEAESKKLASIIPDYADAEKGKAVRSDIRNYGKKIGFSDEELSQVYDSRAVETLWKASQYDKLVSSQPEVAKKMKAAPKMLRAGVAQGQKTKSATVNKLKQQLKKSGKTADAQAVFYNMLEG